MTSNSVRKEPFLNAVARKVGHAAGALSNVAQELTGNLSLHSKAFSTSADSTTESPGRRKSPGRKSRSTPTRSTPSRATSTQGKSKVAGARKRKPTAAASKRSRPTGPSKEGRRVS
jgi:hypothetical protein